MPKYKGRKGFFLEILFFIYTQTRMGKNLSIIYWYSRKASRVMKTDLTCTKGMNSGASNGRTHSFPLTPPSTTHSFPLTPPCSPVYNHKEHANSSGLQGPSEESRRLEWDCGAGAKEKAYTPTTISLPIQTPPKEKNLRLPLRTEAVIPNRVCKAIMRKLFVVSQKPKSYHTIILNRVKQPNKHNRFHS